MKLLKLGGITFRFHWVFLLLLFLLAFYGYLGETLILFSLVLAHETVHMLIARAHGLEVGDVELFPFGGVARIEDVLELDPQVESNVALAGPLFNFVLVAISMVLYANLPGWQQNEMFLFFIRCNLVLGFLICCRHCRWMAAVFCVPAYADPWGFNRPRNWLFASVRLWPRCFCFWVSTCFIPAIFT